MSVGIVLLVHMALDRAEQVARFWAKAGCPDVIHVDRCVSKTDYNQFVSNVSDIPEIDFSRRFRCEWGTWGIVAATRTASAQMLDRYAHVRHVYLASGACLPLRPVEQLQSYLDNNPRTDFIESVTTADVPWTIGGLDIERFNFSFPFAWKSQRFLFDRYVALQRKMGRRRKIPEGLVPHMGSQWWCLTRQTLSSILNDPQQREINRYFRRVWIPDESYFQTMVRRHSEQIESRSLTLSKFDFQGKPHIFYDDHLQLLRRSDCFVARKIWPHADRLYHEFLSDRAVEAHQTEPSPGKIDRVFSKAVERRTRGRPGLYMHSRFPREDWENGITAEPFTVFQGFSELFEDFENWLSQTIGHPVHGHLFAKDRVHFADGQNSLNGALTDSATLRDYDPTGFLTNLIWNTRGAQQCFQFGPNATQAVHWRIAKAPNATVRNLSGAWAVPLFRSGQNFGDVRKEAARLQRIESTHIDVLQSLWTKARVRIWTLADFVENPMEPLQLILDDIGPMSDHRLSEAPKMVNLRGFGQFLQNLKNQGMQPYLMGDFPIHQLPELDMQEPTRPYLVK